MIVLLRTDGLRVKNAGAGAGAGVLSIRHDRFFGQHTAQLGGGGDILGRNRDKACLPEA